MKIGRHAHYNQVYASDPAAIPGRIEAILEEIEDKYEFVEPEPTLEHDLRRTPYPISHRVD